MPLIIDPDNLIENREIVVSTGSKTIQLQVTGNLSASDGVTLKCVYSKLKELWKSGSVSYIAFPFPMQPITDEQFELINGWDFDKSVPVSGATAMSATVNLIRTGGWAKKNDAGASIEEWSGVVTLGTLEFPDANGRVYYQQATGGPATDIILQVSGGVNQAVQVYQSGAGTYITASADYRNYFKIFSREYGKTYAASALSDIGVTTMTYQVYRFPLTNGTDLKINALDAAMTGSPYNSMSITYYTGSQTRTGLVSASLGGTSGTFKVIISGLSGTTSGTTQQIYNFVQYQLRQNVDIDANPSGTVIGKTAPVLLQYVGDTLYTLKGATNSGTFIDNFSNANINSTYFTDDDSQTRNYPYAAILTIQFGDNLVADLSSSYRVFFTTNGSGSDFGTANAITVQDKNNVFMSGNIGGASSIVKTYDYDGNVQRGAGTAGTPAPITVVAIGLNSAQYVKAVGALSKSEANAVSLVAPLERNYSNP